MRQEHSRSSFFRGLAARRFMAIYLVLAIPALPACTRTEFSEPAARFGTATTEASTAIGAYFLELNAIERDLYLQSNAILREPILEVAADGTETPLLAPVFGPEAIRARIDALTLIGIYGNRLVVLAGSDAPQRFSDNVSVLGDDLQNLGARFGAIDDGANPLDADFTKPVTALVATIGKMYLEARRQNALRAAVEDGAPHVTTILDLIERDLTRIVSLQAETAADQRLSILVTEYNDNRNSWTRDQRVAAAMRIDAAAQALIVARAFKPTTLTGSMRRTLAALVSYAEDDSALASPDALLAYLRQYESDVRTLVAAMKALTS